MTRFPGRAMQYAAAVALCAVAVVGAGYTGAPETEWGVLMIGLPSAVSVRNARQNTTYYILKQTHEPIFRKDDGQNYYSNLMKNWSRDLESSEYELCPDTTLKFNAYSPFGLQEFFLHIRGVTARYDAKAEIFLAGKCVRVKFHSPKRNYLEFLTRYENAPFLRRTENIEDGLGEYSVERLSSDGIVLKRKKRVRNGYNTISFYEYRGSSDPNLNNRRIKDFNLISLFDVPEWVKREYFSLDTVEMKSMNLIINHADPKVRKRIYDCVSPTELRRAIFPKKKDFYDISTILPIGMPGARGGRPLQNCGPEMGNSSSVIKFANWSRESDITLAAYLGSLNAKNGMRIELVNYSPGELIAKVHSKTHPYNLIVIILESINSDYADFFEYFFAEKGYYDFSLGDMQAQYKGVIDEWVPSRKAELASRLAGNLAEKALVLPLYQNVKTLYYPKEIKNLSVGKGFLQYPEVAGLRI